MAGFLKKLASNQNVVDKLIDRGAEMLGEKMGAKPSSESFTAAPTEKWATGKGGKKRALFIGINYHGQQGELRGCINDVQNIRKFISDRCGFSNDDCKTLTDDEHSSEKPTRDNILKQMKWLVEEAAAGDVLFFHYSGHGSQQKDTDGDEADGNDETICPVDYASAGMITDDEMHLIMLKTLPAGVKFVGIFDCCHSGSILDLPFTYTIDGQLVIHEIDNRVAAAKYLLRSGFSFVSGKRDDALKGLISGVRTLTMKGESENVGSGGGSVTKEKMEEKKTAADVVQFSGCQDSQTSADAVIGGQATGAMSYAFIQAMEKHEFHPTYANLLKTTREILNGKYSQIPQLSAGKQLDMNVEFSL